MWRVHQKAPNYSQNRVLMSHFYATLCSKVMEKWPFFDPEEKMDERGIFLNFEFLLTRHICNIHLYSKYPYFLSMITPSPIIPTFWAEKGHFFPKFCYWEYTVLVLFGENQKKGNSVLFIYVLHAFWETCKIG